MFFFLSIFIEQKSYAQLSPKDIETLNEYLNQANQFKKGSEPVKSANFFYKAGMLCLQRNVFQKAIPYFQESAALNIDAKKYDDVKKIYSNLGLIYSNMQDYEKAMVYFESSYKIRVKLGVKDDISSGLIDVAYVLGVQKQNKEAIIKLVQALDIATEINNSRLILICYRMLAENYQNLGDVQKSSDYMNKYTSYQQHFQKKKIEEKEEEDKIKTIVEINKRESENKARQLELELIKKNRQVAEDSLRQIVKRREDSLQMASISLKTEKTQSELLIKESELQKSVIKEQEAQQKSRGLIIYSIIGLLALVSVIVLILWILNRRGRKHNIELKLSNEEIAIQKKNVDAKNSELTDAFKMIEEQSQNLAMNINYAKNIQKVLLPKQENLANFLEESFIYFEPRDQVSGDFFWFTESNIINGSGVPRKKFYISAVDCTGHGVPGALLSMISYNMLENIIAQQKAKHPNEILNELHDGIRRTLRQKTTSNQDGMDMALCSYEKEKNILEYAGAKNPVIYIKNDKLTYVKGDVKPIGGTYFEKTENMSFRHHIIPIDTKTEFYIFSDGLADQVGEETGKKFLCSRLRELFQQIHHLPMEEQREAVKKTFREWKGNREQIDDVLVIGFRLFPTKI